MSVHECCGIMRAKTNTFKMDLPVACLNFLKKKYAISINMIYTANLQDCGCKANGFFFTFESAYN